MPPQGLLTVAAYLPESWQVRFVDENARAATTRDFQWADAVFVSGMHIQRAHINDVIARAHAQGRPVAAGGPSPSGCPEYYPDADMLHLGELGDGTDRLLEYLDTHDGRRDTWKFASQNFRAVAGATSIYHAPRWVPALLFTGVIVWQLVAALFFGWAFVSSVMAGRLAWAPIHAAFATALALWAAFMITDEICKQYDTQSSHVSLFTAQLLTLVSLHLLPS